MLVWGGLGNWLVGFFNSPAYPNAFCLCAPRAEWSNSSLAFPCPKSPAPPVLQSGLKDCLWLPHASSHSHGKGSTESLLRDAVTKIFLLGALRVSRALDGLRSVLSFPPSWQLPLRPPAAFAAIPPSLPEALRSTQSCSCQPGEAVPVEEGLWLQQQQRRRSRRPSALFQRAVPSRGCAGRERVAPGPRRARVSARRSLAPCTPAPAAGGWRGWELGAGLASRRLLPRLLSAFLWVMMVWVFWSLFILSASCSGGVCGISFALLSAPSARRAGCRSHRGGRAHSIGMHVLCLSASPPSLPIQKQLTCERLMQTFLLSKR